MKNIFILILIKLFLNCSISITHAQDFFEGSLLKGKCIDDSTKTIIPWVNIFNESQRISGNAKDNGEFLIQASTGDTLVFSAVGYLSSVIIVKESFYNQKLIIELEPRTYQIREATIKSVKNYTQFKQDFVQLELKQTALDSVSADLNVKAKKVARKAEYDRMVEEVFAREKGTLFVLGTSIKSKKSKQVKALNRVKRNEHEQKLIETKYNKEIVQEYTKLKGDQLKNFMLFCNLSSDFLMEASDYEIALKIKEKLEKFQLENQ